MKRITIYPKDIHILTGKSERYCRKVIAEIKASLQKKKHQVVTIEEFCAYMGIEKSEIIDQIK